jgi:large subunit ribosomal protein L23
MDAYDIFLAPILTEKTNLLREGNEKVYVFRVDMRANKLLIEEAAQKLFGVKPVSVRIVVNKGKPKRYLGRGGGREFGQTSRFKKAYIKLAAGQKIEKFEGV